MFTTGYGGWETFDLTNVDRSLPTHWSVMSPGIEETVALALYSPHQRRAPGHGHRRLLGLRAPGSRQARARRQSQAALPGEHQGRQRRRAEPERDRPRRARPQQGPEHRLLAGWREELARTGVGPRSEGQRRRHRRLRRWRPVGLDAARARLVRHVGQGGELEPLRGVAERHARGGRPREPQALLRRRALRREAVREHRRRGALRRAAAGAAGWIAQARQQRQRQPHQSRR